MKKQTLIVLIFMVIMPFFLKAQADCTNAANLPQGVNIIPTPASGKLTCLINSVILETTSTTPNLEFSWSSGQNGATITVTEAKAYTVTVTNLTTGCTTTKTFTVVQDLSTPANVQIITACNASDVALVASSSSPTTTFQWDGGPPFATKPITVSGTYSVTATLPETGCTTRISKTTNPLDPLPIDITGGLSLCNVAKTTLTATGGTPTDAYLWIKDGNVIPNVTSASIDVTQTGKYAARVTGPGGCMGTKEVEVVGSSLSVSLGEDKPICSGTVELKPVVTGGTATGYLWSNGKTDPTITVGAGTYSVTVTGGSNCVASDEIVVSSSTTLPAPYVGTGTFCGCGQVVAKARRQPSVVGKMFVWYDNPDRTGTALPSTMSLEGDISLFASTTNRIVWAFEKEGDCYSAGSRVVITVFPVPQISPSVSGTNIKGCSSATVTVKPSTTGHTAELWSTPNQTPGTQLTLGADGSYTTSVTKTVYAHETESTTCGSGDVLKCYGPATEIVLTIGSGLTVNAGADISTCSGSSVNLTATTSGGTAPFSYAWSNGATTASTFVSTGDFTVTATDANGCGATDAVKVSVGSGLTVNAGADVAINAGSSTTLKALVSGGISPYTYKWSNGATTESTTVSEAKTYSVEATDKNGCKGTDEVIITVSNIPICTLKADLKTKEVSCNSTDDGQFTVTPKGGTAPFQYKLNEGSYQSSNVFSNLKVGTYTIEIKDAYACKYVLANLKLSKLQGLVMKLESVENPQCSGYTNGEIYVRTIGGSGNEKYTKDNGVSFQKNSNFYGLSAGTYVVFIKNASGCESNKETVVLKNPTPITYTMAKTDETCSGNDGSIIFTATGGTSTLFYSIDNGDTWQKSNVFKNLKNGTRILQVRDANWCESKKQSVKIEQGNSISFKTSQDDVSCGGKNDGSIKVHSVKGGSGSAYQYSKDDGSTWQSDNEFTNLKAGAYKIRVKDGKGCISHRCDVDIVKSSAPSFSIVKEDIYCGHQANGVIAVTKVRGGCYPYKYSCDGGVTYQTSNSFTTQSAGKYLIVVKDYKGCVSNTEEVTIVNKCQHKNSEGSLERAKPTQLIPVVMSKVTPNPTPDVVQVTLTSLTEREQEFVFFNIYGQPMKVEKRNLVKGEQNIIFDCTDMQGGFYQITTTGSYSRNLIMRFLKL